MRRPYFVGGTGYAVAAPTPDPDPDPNDPDWSFATDLDFSSLFSTNTYTVEPFGEGVQATGFKPANGAYNGLWTRDHAYTLWHNPGLLTAAQRRQFVSYYISRRTTGVESDPDGGTLPADFVADRINTEGGATYKNSGGFSDLPFMDGIHFVILALWADWNLTGDTSTFTANQDAIDDCLAAIPRSANGCVYSDPSATSVDYGFTDTVVKEGDVAYGTALQAWAYKMCAEMAGESGSGTYSTLRAAAESGLATLRRGNGFYSAASVSDPTHDDVWATALIVAEGLVSGTDRTASATALRDGYLADELTYHGWVKHLPIGQTWDFSWTGAGSYQNGGFWMTPLWDCVRSVLLVDEDTALAWATEAVDEVRDQITASGVTLAPYEWITSLGSSTPKGYTCHAAMIERFS